jgi:D-cysteine desulfhydrase
VGVVVNETLRLDAPSLVRLARRTERLLRRRGAPLPPLLLAPERLIIVRDWLGPGYGHATLEGLNAQALAAAGAGLMLEPVYTAKAMAALLAMIQAGRLADGPVVFLHTDGPR